jgi:Flp pilus assembly pilin Flp
MRNVAKSIWKQLKDDSGQGMVEYILIIGLIVLFIIAALILFKDTVLVFIDKVKGWIDGKDVQ